MVRLGLRCGLALCAGLFLALAPGVHGPVQAGEQVLLEQGGLLNFHGRKVTEAHCLDKNYWWFYRPYTTAGENYPRCEPYFHYLEPTGGSGNAWADRAMK
ncbi:MAG: hypothetical protein AAF405_03550 [Pseudomonadota bacterium]